MYYWHVIAGSGCVFTSGERPLPDAVITRYAARRFNVGGREETTPLAKRNLPYYQRLSALRRGV